MKSIHPLKTFILTAAVGCVTLSSLGLHAATILWTNTASGSWNTAANWNPNQVPGTNDTAVITNSGVTVSLSGTAGAGAIVLGTNGAGTVTLSLNGQTLSLYGPLTVNTSGSFTVGSGVLAGSPNAVLSGAIGWTAGSLAGTFTIATNSTLTLAGGGGNLYWYNCTVTNYGTVTWSSGYPDGGSNPTGTQLYNYGLWDCQSDYQFRNDGGGAGTVFNNYGTLRKSAGSSASQTLFPSGVVLNQLNGKVDLQQGNLLLQGGGTFTGGTATNNNGGLNFSAGNFTLNGTVTGTNVVQTGGTLVGNNVINGALIWSGGSWQNTPSVTIATNSTLTLAGGGGNLICYNCAVTNYGTVAWSSGYPDGGSNPTGTQLYNYGLWDCQSDYNFREDGGGSGVVFYNYGTLRKSGGSSASQTLFPSGVVLNQLNGKVDLQQGNLVLEGGGNFTGGTATNNNGGLYFSAGSFNLDGTATGTNVIQNGGSLAGNNVINGGLIWSAGSWQNTPSVTIATNSTLTLAGGGGNLICYNCAVTNYGTVAWSSGYPDGGSNPTGTQVYNYGLWDCQSDYTFRDDGGGAETVFYNYGTLRKSGGASEFANATTFLNGVTFDQLAGVIDVQNGTNGLQLAFQGGGNFTGGYITTNQFGLTTLEVGNYKLNGTVTGTNTWETDNGNLIGTNVIKGALTWYSGNWDSAPFVTIAPNSLMTIIGGAANMYMYNCTVTNYGTVIWSSGNPDGGSTQGTQVYNYGLWDCQSDYDFKGDGGGAGTVFNNYGTLRKSGGGPEFSSATYFQNVAFNQLAGVIDVQNGTNGLQLDFQDGGNFTGGYITTNQFGLTVLSIGNFNLNGTVTGTNTWEDTGNLAGTCVINGSLTWVGGTWNPTTSVTIPAGSSVLAIGGTGNLDMNATTVINNGVFTWASGALRGGTNTFINNYGLWNCQSDQQINDAYGGGSVVFNNYGTLRKSGGGPEFANNTVFQNGVIFNQLSGVLDVQNSTNGLQLAFLGGGNLLGGYVTTNTQGLLNLAGGNFNLNGLVTGTNTWLNGANLAGTNVIRGAMSWYAGNWNPSYFVTIATNSTLIAAGTGNLDFNDVIVTNNGTVAWANGTFRGGGGTTVYNHGLWDCQSDQTFNDAYGGIGVVFNNLGTLRKSGGGPEFTNATYFSGGVLFNQLAGVIDVQNSTNGLQLDFQGGGNFTGGYITTNQFGLTVLSVGSFNLNGTVTGTNTWEDAGNLAGTNVIHGALTWVAGNWNPSYFVTIATNSTLIVAGGANNMDMNAVIVTNNGTVAWSSGTLRGGSGTTIYNQGVWNAQSDQIFNDAYGGAGTFFNNAGTFVKTAGANNGSGTQIQNGVAFNNSGRLDCQAGVISLQGAYSLTNGTLNFGINSRTNYGLIGLAGAAPLVGTLSANLNNGYIPINGNSFTNLYYSSFTGGFTNTVLPFADAWVTNYFPTYYVMTVLNARPVFAPLATNTFVVNELTTLNVTNTATDLNIPTETLTYSLIAGPSGATFNPATTIFTWTPPQTNSPSTNVVSVAVVNNGVPPLIATNTFTVIVREVNVPPSLPTIATQIVNELTLLTVTNSATNFNIHSTITGYSLVNPPAGMSISAAGVITWTPAQTQSPGTNLITTIVTNSNPYDLVNPQLTATNTFTVIVREVNVPPSLPAIATQIVNELTLLTVTNSATNANLHSTIIGYTLVNPLAGMSISTSGIFSWTPAQTESPGTNLVTAIVTNSNPYDLVNPKLTATNTFAVIVKEVNVAPVLPVISSQTATVLHLFTLNNAATNANLHSTNFGYVLIAPPAGAAISSSGVITWTPAASQSLSTNTITTVVTNGNPYDSVNPHLTATNNFAVVVLPNLAATNITQLLVGKTNLNLSWPADHTGWRLETQTNAVTVGLRTTWTTVANSTLTNQVNIPINKTNATVFFRMIYP